MQQAPDDQDEQLSLSAHTLAALQDFLTERQQAEAQRKADPFAEDWSLSQFWYDTATCQTVAQEVVDAAGGEPIACIACPSLFRQLRSEFPEQPAHLFEYDPRFEVLGSFSLYDYREPTQVAPALRGHFAVVCADPPYLSEECLTNTAVTMRLLSRAQQPPKHFLLTGAVMRQAAYKLLRLRPVRFRPQHRNKLGNEFLLYTDVPPSPRLQGWDEELDPSQEL